MLTKLLMAGLHAHHSKFMHPSFYIMLALLALSCPPLTAEDFPPSDPFDPFTQPQQQPRAKAPEIPLRVFLDSQGRAYFPKEDTNYSTSFYTAQLNAMKEPSLLPQKDDKEKFAMRFLWLRSFHDPIAIRVWKEGEDYHIRGVKMTRSMDDGPDQFTKDLARKLDQEEWLQIARLSESPDTWKPLSKEEREELGTGLDGSNWIFEKSSGQEHSMVHLWSPRGHDAESYKKDGVNASKVRDFSVYVRLALLLLKLTELTPEEKDIY